MFDGTEKIMPRVKRTAVIATLLAVAASTMVTASVAATSSAADRGGGAGPPSVAGAGLASVAGAGLASVSGAEPPSVSGAGSSSVAGAESPSVRGAAGPLEWSDCGGGVECSTLTVPVDWAAPREERMRLNLVRVPAADPQRRLGSVVVNLGAGNSTQSVRGQLPAGLRGLHERFDLVVFDPPGLGTAGNGTLVRCPHLAASVYGLVADASPAAWRAHAATNARYDAGCRDAAGASFAHLTSWQVAHDLEAMRAALDEPRLRYLGNSYATAYWQAYAELFSGRVGPTYLDGVTDPFGSVQPALLCHDFMPDMPGYGEFRGIEARIRKVPAPPRRGRPSSRLLARRGPDCVRTCRRVRVSFPWPRVRRWCEHRR
ncbi:MAG: alpha/beta fold hydrolase [Streptosporangiales bacterium]|nr:alpha/beta fold hydrolase [Streptosporangiales bacterium]